MYSSQKSVQMSSETSITYGTPDKINENDSPANEIDVVLNLFFDGTGNNKSNTEARKLGTESYHKYSDKKEDSYEVQGNDDLKVVSLDCCIHILLCLKSYRHGIKQYVF